MTGWLDQAHFDRTDARLLRIGLWVCAGAVALTRVGYQLWAWIVGGSIPVTVQTQTSAAQLERHGVEHHVDDHVSVMVSPDAAGRIVELLPGLVISALVVWGVFLLDGLIRSVTRSDAFGRGNIRALKLLGILVVVGSLLEPTLTNLAHQWVAGREFPWLGSGAESVFTVRLVPVAIGMVLAMLGEAFAQGARQKEDLEGVI